MPLTLIILIVLLYFWLRSYSLTVTDKRVYGQTAFGKRVDLPIDSVSAVGTSALKGISVGTSSGKISFKLIKNQVEMHSVISNLLKERQEKEKSQTVTKETTVNQTIIEQTSADELKKFKELLDMGAITQDEFDAKKKELLGL
ncbi:MAG: SHOCT domain-containing protein [Ruminococcaceae bacterium]|nr:SHOCT domain-containing protein [Oscillospiraceae bacterium]